MTGGPWRVNERAAEGSYSLKADVTVWSGHEMYLKSTADRDLSSASTLTAKFRTAPWGNHGSGTTARLFVKTGSGWTWHAGPSVAVTSSGATASFDLTGITDRANVRDIGVQFTGAAGSSGGTAIYTDDITTSG